MIIFSDKCKACPWKKDAGNKLVCMFSKCVKGDEKLDLQKKNKQAKN